MRAAVCACTCESECVRRCTHAWKCTYPCHFYIQFILPYFWTHFFWTHLGLIIIRQHGCQICYEIWLQHFLHGDRWGLRAMAPICVRTYIKCMHILYSNLSWSSNWPFAWLSKIMAWQTSDESNFRMQRVASRRFSGLVCVICSISCFSCFIVAVATLAGVGDT